jgi:hypothetical protein
LALVDAKAFTATGAATTTALAATTTRAIFPIAGSGFGRDASLAFERVSGTIGLIDLAVAIIALVGLLAIGCGKLGGTLFRAAIRPPTAAAAAAAATVIVAKLIATIEFLAVVTLRLILMGEGGPVFSGQFLVLGGEVFGVGFESDRCHSGKRRKFGNLFRRFGL